MNRTADPPFGFLGRLFLATEDERIYAIVRIAFSITALVNLCELWPHRETFFAITGMVDLAEAVERSEMASVLLFHGFQTPGQVTLLMSLAGVAMVMLMLGILPRLAAAAVFLWHLSYFERGALPLTGWDMVLRAFAFLVLVSPLGRCWTLPALWQKSALRPRQVARYGLILMRLQVAAIYLQTVVAKAIDIDGYWRSGEFLPYFLMSRYARWPTAWAAAHPDLLQLGTYVALLTEAAIPVLLLVRRTRLWGMLLGVLFHGFVAVISRTIEPFLLAMMMAYLAFLTRQDVEWLQRRCCPVKPA